MFSTNASDDLVKCGSNDQISVAGFSTSEKHRDEPEVDDYKQYADPHS